MLAVAAPAAAKSKTDSPPPAQITRLLACRAIVATADRLACFDRESAVVGEAVKKQELVVFDRESVRKTRTSLFGFAIPNLGIFGDDSKDAVKQIDGVLASFGHNVDGGYIFILQDGGRWSQIDDRPLGVDPRQGDKVVVKRAAMGSYMLSVARQPGVRVKRIN
jgi:hypothetical protein